MKLLFVTPHDLNDLQGNGGIKAAQRNYELLKRINDAVIEVCILRRKDYCEDKLSVLSINQPDGNIGDLIAALFGYKKIFPWDALKIKKHVKKNKYDLVWIDSSLIGNLAFLRRYCKVIVSFQNCEFDYSMNKVKKEGYKYLLSALSSKVNEKRAVKADRIFCLNKRDSDRIFELYKRKADYYLPITFKDVFDESKIRRNDDKNLLFIGSYFEPNADSIMWFIQNVMCRLSDFKLVIVGRGFETIKQDIESMFDNVSVIGSADDLEEYYYSYSVMVMPILYGAGMKVKTAEAMMYGKTIIASQEALEGYETEGVNGIYRCNSADEYYLTIKKIFDEPNTDLFYQKDVRQLFLDKYTTDSVFNSVKSAIGDLIE